MEKLENGVRMNGNRLVKKCGCKPPVQPRLEGEEALTEEEMMELTAWET